MSKLKGAIRSLNESNYSVDEVDKLIQKKSLIWKNVYQYDENMLYFWRKI